MLTLIIGTDWVANREKILSMLSADVAAEKAGRILMVPELISHDAERRLSAAAGDTCSRFAEVLSFTRLASRVSESIGHAAMECLDNGGRVVAMAAAVRQLHSRLKAYASLETRPEFLTGLVDAVDEFKRCNIRPEDLQHAAHNTEGSFAQKLEELSLIYESYDCICQLGKRDPRDRMNWLLDELADGTYGQEHVFYVDGFPDFTRQHMAILMHLICVSENVIVSLNCDEPGSTAMAFEKAGATASELIRHAKGMGIPLNIIRVPSRKDALDPVRSCLLQGNISSCESNLPVKVYRADTLHRECKMALGEVLRLVRAGARYRDISIACADMPAYENTMKMIFHRGNIPLYIAGTEDILEKTAISTVLAALDTVLSGFEQQSVFQYLKSSMSPLPLESCDRLENYAVLWGITGKKWLQEWTNHPDGLDGRESEYTASKLKKLNEDRVRAIEPLQRLRNGLYNGANVRQQVLALYNYLEDIEIADRLSKLAEKLDRDGDNRNAQILNQLWDIILTALEQLCDVLGDTIWNPENFTTLFRLLLSQYDVGTIPPVLDAVSIGPVNAMRCQQCKHLIVIGASEGCLPGYSGSSGVLTDQERDALRELGVPLTGGALEGLQMEFSEIYGVFCGAGASVYISHSGPQPSVVYSRLAAMSGGEKEAEDILGGCLVDRDEAGALLVRHGDLTAASELGLQNEYDAMLNRVAFELGDVSPQNIKKLYGDVLHLSASQIDKQAQCRMCYFLRYGLGAKERKPIMVDPAEFGTYVHAVMENTVREVMGNGGFKVVPIENMLEIANKYSREYADERFSMIDSNRVKYLLERNSSELEMIVRELWEEMQECDFEPVGYEVGFGEERDVPAINVSGNSLSAHLRGFVDRVDAWEHEGKHYFRIVDYKTGKKDFDYCDIYNGYGLQMLLYLFALEDGAEKLLGKEPIPAGVQYFPARVPLVSSDGLLSQEEADEMRLKQWKRRGLLLSTDYVLHAMEHSPEPKRLPFTCRKDGTRVGDIADRKQISMLKSYVFNLVSSMVDEIASGCVAPNPYSRGASHDACAFCPYGTVCHVQDVTERRNYQAVSAERFWEDVEREVKKNG